ncbi:MAG: glycoside hydrolase family 57 protein [Candidatus Omnitrophota bacterium]
MLHLAFIYHMHQPYYRNLLTQETDYPWVRLHGLKDYLDMVKIAQNYPKVHLTFNLVPSLIEQVEHYVDHTVKDKFLELSYKPAVELTREDKAFLLDNFFKINKDKVIACSARYYNLYFKKQSGHEFNEQDFRDLQVWFNLAWTDPLFRKTIPALKAAVEKERFYTEEDKKAVLDTQLQILRDIIPGYKQAIEFGQIEVTLSPFYHPILPLLCNTTIAREANLKSTLPKINFSYPQDAKAQIDEAVRFFEYRFGSVPAGMWPSEEGVSEHILPFIIESGIKWIVTDEAILFKSLNKKKRDTSLLYQPHLLKREEGELSIIFRDRNLSDLIGFVYYNWTPKAAVDDLMGHLKNIANAFKDQDALVTIAMDGENAWEYYSNDGHDFLNEFYQRLSEADFLKSVTVKEYLESHKPTHKIRHLGAGSWIYGEFSKWINNPLKNKAWEYLALARKELEDNLNSIPQDKKELIWKQMYICEGSDWFWWYGDGQMDFDSMFRMHLSNFYTLLNKPIPDYLKKPLSA